MEALAFFKTTGVGPHEEDHLPTTRESSPVKLHHTSPSIDLPISNADNSLHTAQIKKKRADLSALLRSTISQPRYRIPFITVEIATVAPASTAILFPTDPSTLVSACNRPAYEALPEGVSSYEAKYNS